jgi:hypothetical protein
MSARRWPRNARWFLAEFMVVLTGVLVALALNAWWGERQNRQLERAYLLQLHEDLAASEADLSMIADEMMTRALHSAAVGHAFWDPSSTSAEDLMVSLGAPLSANRTRPVLGTAQALVATGDLRLIRSDRLRSELMSYLEWSQARIDNIARFDETYYRPGVALISERFDPTALRRLAGNATGRNVDLASFALSMRPAADGAAPFPVALGSILQDADVYRGYSQLLIGHRNQAFEYGRMAARSRYLRNLVHQELYGVPDPGNCQLEPGIDGFSGSCGHALPGQAPLVLELRPVEALATGRWRTDGQPTRSWAGRALQNGAASDVEVEVDLHGHGVIRTAFGWFQVRDLPLAERTARLSFRITGDTEAPPSDLDASILRRARELLHSEATWDREDDRSCARTDGLLSLYCALRQATVDVTGGFHHRRPALQTTRRIVAERSTGRDYEHRLRDYNNDPRTSLADIHSLLDEALAVMTGNRGLQ